MVEKLVLNGANFNTKGAKASVQIPIVLGYTIASVCGIFSKQARHKAEMLGLMVKEPKIDRTKLSSVSSNTLVIAGTNDMIKEKHTKLLAEYIPNSRLVFIDGDHFIANKNPEIFNTEVENFLLRP